MDGQHDIEIEFSHTDDMDITVDNIIKVFREQHHILLTREDCLHALLTPGNPFQKAIEYLINELSASQEIVMYLETKLTEDRLANMGGVGVDPPVASSAQGRKASTPKSPLKVSNISRTNSTRSYAHSPNNFSIACRHRMYLITKKNSPRWTRTETERYLERNGEVG